MQRAIVSGATGHLGQEVARQLASAGVQVHGLTRQEVARDGAAGEPSVHLHRVDGQLESLLSVFNEVRPDVVFHIAGFYRREHQAADVAALMETNIHFGVQLLEAMRLAECRHLVTAGSYFQHFDADAYRPLNLYAATKQAFEDLIAYYVDACDISAVRLTVCDIYSEYDTRRKLMTDIATAWASKTPLHFKDEEIWVDLVHVEDAAAAFFQAAKLLETNLVPHHALTRYSITSGRNVTSVELIALFESLGGRKLLVNRGRGWQLPRRMKPWCGAVLPGWTPRVSIEDGIVRLLERWQQ